jgi:hypothetical protein
MAQLVRMGAVEDGNRGVRILNIAPGERHGSAPKVDRARLILGDTQYELSLVEASGG